MVFPPCGMLKPKHPDDPDQTDEYCGEHSVWKSIEGPNFCICHECHESMKHDPDLVVEFNYVGMLR